MLFDVFCKLAEISGDRFLKCTARNAALFDLPYIPHEILPKSVDEDQYDFLQENFFLPFPITAIEDKASLCILYDLVQDQQGLNEERGFVEFMCFGADLKNFRPESVPLFKPEGMSNAYGLIQGTVKMRATNDRRQEIQGGVLSARLFDSDTGELMDASDMVRGNQTSAEMLTASELRNAKTALEEVMYFNTPERFIVQVTPRVVRPSNAPKIPRSHERPRYLLLRPHEIRERLGISDEQHEKDKRASPNPHPRRKHYRTFRSDRYVKVQGKTITIPATWIGKSEGEVRGRKYKVMLDM